MVGRTRRAIKWHDGQIPSRHACRIKEILMNNLVYIIGLIVIVIAILSFFGLR